MIIRAMLSSENIELPILQRVNKALIPHGRKWIIDSAIYKGKITE